MEGELTNFCRTYYGQLCLHRQLERRFTRLLANALPYTGQTNVNELDAVIRCNREIQQARTEAEDAKAAMQKTAGTLLKIFAYFEMPPDTKLQCEVPGEFELQVWAEEDNSVHCIKTKDLNPLKGDPSVIIIKLKDDPYSFDDDDE